LRHSLEFKQSAVEKLLNRGGRSIKEISDAAGVSGPSLYRWRDELGSVGIMKKTLRPQDRSPTEKLKILSEIDGLSAESEITCIAGLHGG
jgi:transposase-like protein